MYSTMYTRLRAQELAKSTKPYLAKGKSVKRCVDCQMAQHACMCAWRASVACGVDVVVLMHRLELFKPTNTGRLIADVLPNAQVFLWHRTQPDNELLALINDPERECLLVFPYQNSVENPRIVVSDVAATHKKRTLILLDGSWRQCSRMLVLSRWLDRLPCLSLPEGLVRSYVFRDSGRDDRFSTVEAAISCLQLAGESSAAHILQHYFLVFHQHYLATRGCYSPQESESHRVLAECAVGM